MWPLFSRSGQMYCTAPKVWVLQSVWLRVCACEQLQSQHWGPAPSRGRGQPGEGPWQLR